MKKMIVMLLTLCSLLISADIAWQPEIVKAFEKAEREHKLVMVMVEGKHCRWCKKMRYRTLDDGRVAKKLASYINVRVDEEDKEVMATLPMINGVPTIFFFTPDQKVIERVEGYYDAADFLSFFKEIERKVWAVEKPEKE